MIVQTDIIDAYINETKKPEDDAWFYAYTKGTGPLLNHRQEVCKVLLDECIKYKEFPVWNQAFLYQVLPNLREKVRDFILLPIIGTHEKFETRIIRYDRINYVLIDLLHIADYTDSVKEMTYILHNQLHKLLLRFYYERKDYKDIPYIQNLEERFFYEGFILYATWNEDQTQYVFQTPSYDAKKEKVFGMLYQALHIEDAQTQTLITNLIPKADLWERFPDAAGMFYFDDLFHIGGVRGLMKVLYHSPKGIFNTIFNE